LFAAALALTAPKLTVPDKLMIVVVGFFPFDAALPWGERPSLVVVLAPAAMALFVWARRSQRGTGGSQRPVDGRALVGGRATGSAHDRSEEQSLRIVIAVVLAALAVVIAISACWTLSYLTGTTGSTAWTIVSPVLATAGAIAVVLRQVLKGSDLSPTKGHSS
jgi:hypothetical protein